MRGRPAAIATALACCVALSACARTDARTGFPTAPRVLPSQQHLDAHDGGIVQFGDTYYLYGTANGCGFQWQVPGTRYCGVAIYSSTDLRSWRSRGLAFDPSEGDWQAACTPGGCFRPHVVFNAHTGKYVMWLQVFTPAGFRDGYRVLTSDSPTGPWLRAAGGRVATPSGDENLFVDTDGTGYLVRTDLAGRVTTTRSHELQIDQLDDTYTTVVRAVFRPAVGYVEAPTLFKRDGRYYLLYSDPACPYCQGTGTSVLSAESLSGPWSGPYSISARSCDGQPTMVSPLTVGGAAVYLYQADQWLRLGQDRITRNQTAATQAWAPLQFAPDGRIRPLDCPG